MMVKQVHGPAYFLWHRKMAGVAGSENTAVGGLFVKRADK